MKGLSQDLVGTRWAGEGELWLDPKGNEVTTYPCSMTVEDGVVRYRWTYEGKTHEGSLTLRDGGADFTDTWHSPQLTPCDAIAGSWAMVDVAGTYAAPEGPPWGWRTTVSLRPSGELVLQMTNFTPWGEHGRAVRMVCKRA